MKIKLPNARLVVPPHQTARRIMLLRALSIRAKLFLSFGIVFILVAGIGGLALLQLRAVNDVAREMRAERLPNVQLLGKMQVLVLRTRTNGARLITADTPPWYLWLGYRNGWLNVLRRQILDFVGLKVTHMKVVGTVRDATPERIAGFMAAARKLAG